MSDVIRLARHSDARGHLVAVSSGAEVPFEIRRVFWIYGNVDDRMRAGHASATTTELLVSVAGSCRARVDGPAGARTVELDRPDASLLVPPMTWLVLSDFSPDCVLLVLADTDYDPGSAIVSPDRFRELRSR